MRAAAAAASLVLAVVIVYHNALAALRQRPEQHGHRLGSAGRDEASVSVVNAAVQWEYRDATIQIAPYESNGVH